MSDWKEIPAAQISPTSSKAPIQTEPQWLSSLGNSSAPTDLVPYPLMAIPTGKGLVQISVELQAASRMADEKRKRNMAASAHLRARRKEKEREATMKVAILESQLRDAATKVAILESQLSDAAEEIEWYKKEGQELLIALQTLPGGERHLPREK